MKTSIFLTLFNDPQACTRLSVREWEHVINQGRSANLLSRLDSFIHATGLSDQLPERPRQHLESARKQVAAQHRHVLWEIQRVSSVLEDLDAPAIILKGGAYIYSQQAAQEGRTLNDIDILVPKALLPEVEKRLLVEGYITTKVNDYDIKYYREWSHEIPPLQHYRRGTTLDVHHNILPTLKRHLDPNKLIAKAQVNDRSNIGVLHLQDMLIHSAAHLFLEGEFDSALRDLSDMALLFDELNDAGDWQRLVERAQELGLLQPLFYAYRYSQPLYRRHYHQDALFQQSLKPGKAKLWVMDTLFRQVLIPHHASCKGLLFRPASLLLYMRGHYLRMPLTMLIPHLLRKALKPAESSNKVTATP